MLNRRMWRRGLVLLLASLALVGVRWTSPGKEARGDDAYRTSSLVWVEDWGGEGDSQFVANVSTAEPGDARLEILVVWYDDNDPESLSFHTWVDRPGSGAFDAEVAIEPDEFPNTNIKVYFRAYDSSGSLTWTNAREVSTG